MSAEYSYIHPDHLQMAKRLAWLIYINMGALDHEDHATNVDDCWNSKTPAVKQKTFDELDWILGIDDALDRDCERYLNDGWIEEHGEYLRTHYPNGLKGGYHEGTQEAS